MTCVCHHNVTQSSYIVVKTLCALPSPHQEDTPDVAPSAPGLMQKLPLLRGSKTKQSQTADTPEKPRRGNAGSRPENRTPGRRGPGGGSHGGRQRGLTQRGRGRPRRDGGDGQHCPASDVGARAMQAESSGPEPERRGQPGGRRNVLPTRAQGVRLQALENAAQPTWPRAAAPLSLRQGPGQGRDVLLAWVRP